jgi:hypothetical protein
MKEHFGDLRGVELALIFGRSYDVRFRSLLIADLTVPRDMAGQEHWVERIRRGGRAVAEAPDAPTAPRELTEVASACAGCHLEVGAVIDPDVVPPPSDRGDLDSRMRRHQWAADRLWDSLVMPSDQRWQQGLDVLAASATSDGHLITAPARRAQGARLERQLAAAARAARNLDRSGRASAYAGLLSTCRACHSLATTQP